MGIGASFGSYLPGGAIGRATVYLALDAASYERQLAEAQGLLEKTQLRMSQAGGMLSKAVTLPLLAVGAVSIKAASDYEAAFGRIQGMTNASSKTIEIWKEQVLSIAGKTAQAPTALADGLYFLASAGLKTSQIMPVLTASAKAASAGMGDLSDVAKLTANVLNAYAGTGLKASKVTDTLAAAIKAGSAEPDQFATAMGRVLPIASKAGVSFDELAGSLAAMSNIGLDVNEGVTAMRGLLGALEAPGTQAAQTLHNVGISVDEMRNVIQNQGILAALQLLQDRTHGNIDEMQKIVPNIRALTGAFSLSGNRAKAAADAFDHTTHSTGALNQAFEARKQTSAFKFAQLMTELKIAAIRLGNVMLPVVKQIVEQLTKWAKAFADLDPHTREMIVKVALLAAALGPLLVITSKVITAVRVLGTAMRVAGVAGGAWAAALALVAVAAYKVHGYLSMDNEKANEWTKTIVFGKNSLQQYADAVNGVGEGESHLQRILDGSQTVMDAYGKTVKAVTAAYDAFALKNGATTDTMDAFTSVMQHAQGITRGEGKQVVSLMQAFHDIRQPISAVTLAQIGNLLAMGDATAALRLLRAQYALFLGPLQKAKDTLGDVKQAHQEAALKADVQTAALKRLNGEIQRLPDHKRIVVQVDTSSAMIEIANLKASIGRALSRWSP